MNNVRLFLLIVTVLIISVLNGISEADDRKRSEARAEFDKKMSLKRAKELEEKLERERLEEKHETEKLDSLPLEQLTLEQQIDRRKREAIQKRILQKAMVILDGFGVGEYMKSEAFCNYRGNHKELRPGMVFDEKYSQSRFIECHITGYGHYNIIGKAEAIFGDLVISASASGLLSVYYKIKLVFSFRNRPYHESLIMSFCPGEEWERIFNEQFEKAAEPIREKKEFLKQQEAQQEAIKLARSQQEVKDREKREREKWGCHDASKSS